MSRLGVDRTVRPGRALTLNNPATLSGSAAATIGNNTAAVIGGASGLTKSGVNTVTLNGSTVHTFTGGLTLNGGTLAEDFSNLGATGNLINNGNALTFGGGVLTLKGNAANNSSQGFGNVTVNAGGGSLLVTPNGSGRTATVTVGTLTATTAGGSLLLGAATTTGTTTITTNSAKDSTTGIYGRRIVWANGTAYDWATSASAGPAYTLGAYGTAVGTYTALPASGASATVNYNLTAAITGVGTESVNTLKVAGVNLTQTAGTTLTLASGGLLSVGTAAATISAGYLTAGNYGSGSYDLVVHQYNSAGSGLTISSVIADNGANTVNLVKAGNQILILAGANTYGGSTYVNSGILDFGGISMSGFGGGAGQNIYVAAGAAVKRNSANLDSTFMGRLVPTTDEIALLTTTGTLNVDLTPIPNAFIGGHPGNGGKVTLLMSITPGNNTYRLGSTWNDGTLIEGSGSGSTPFADNGTAARSLLIGASARDTALAVANTLSGDTVIRAGGALAILTPLALQNSALNVGVTGGANAGIFKLGNGVNGVTGESAVPNPTFGGLKGSRDLLTAFSAVNGGFTVLPSTSVTGFTLNPGLGNVCAYSGAIGEFTNGTFLVKTGAGTQILSGTNAYTGPTSVNGGTLLINSPGSLNASSAVTVNTSGTLGGNGTINGSVTVADGGNLSPGASGAGTLSIGGNLDISAMAGGTAGKLLYELGPTNASDKIVVGGTLTLGSGLLGFSSFVFTNVGGLQAGTYTLITSTTLSGSLNPADQTGTIGAFNATLQTNGSKLELAISQLTPAPAVALTSPTNHQYFVAPANIPLTASVTNNGHTILQVNYYNGPSLVGSSSTGPDYAASWSAVAAGTYNLTAVALYDTSLTVTSPPPDTITVLGQPVLMGAGPRSGSSFPLTFSGPSGQTYSVVSSTNLALPRSSWTPLTNGTFGGSPVNFIDTRATNAQQYYQIQSP